MSVCTKYCDKCFFLKNFGGGENGLRYCDFLCMTNKRRPCPAGDGCTVFVTRREHEKKERTAEERAALTEWHNERKREYKRRKYQGMTLDQKEKRKIYNREQYQKHKEERNAKHREYYEANKERLREYNRERKRKMREAMRNGNLSG